MAPPEAPPVNIVEIYIIVIDLPIANPPPPVVNILNMLEIEEEVTSAPVAGEWNKAYFFRLFTRSFPLVN